MAEEDEREPDGARLEEGIGVRPGDFSGLMAAIVEANDRVTADGPIPFCRLSGHPSASSIFILSKAATDACTVALIQHILAERKITPPGIVFPVSSVSPDLSGLEGAENSL